MHTTNLTKSATETLSAYRQQKWTPGLSAHNLIVFPHTGPSQAPADAPPPVSDLTHLVSLFLATADRLADLTVEITRLESQAKAGKISPLHAARSLRRILAVLENSLSTLDLTPL
jgi:hypothetical protein